MKPTRTKRLFQSSLLVILFFGIGKLVGLIRIPLVAAVFGTSPEFDAFTAANQLPEVFSTILASNALAAAFIPVYSAYLARNDRVDGARLANTILTLVFLILGGVAFLAALFAPWLTRVLLVPSFDPELQQLTAELMRIILLQTILFGISNGVLSSMLNANQHFALPALAPIALDVGYLLGLYFLVPRYGIHGLAWGTVISGVLHIAIQVPALIWHKLEIRPLLAIQLDGVREIVRLMGPRVITLGAIQVADLFIIRLASGLPSGSTSGYFYGYALMQFPETLFGTAIALVMFPTMAELFNLGDREGMKRTAVNALGIIWTLTIPAAAGLALLGRPAIGRFLSLDEAGTQIVYTVVLVFSVRLVAEATVEIVARLFYAQHDTRTPMFVYIGWLLINVVFAYWFVQGMGLGVMGLAGASSVAFAFLATVLFWLNGRRLGGLGNRQLWLTGGRAIVATAVMSGVIWLLGRTFGDSLLFIGLGTVLGGITYLLVSVALGGRELQQAWRILRRRTAESV